MKFPALLLGFALVCSVVIAGYIHSKRNQEIHLKKQASFLNIKFRVTRDVLGEYQDQVSQSAVTLEKTKKEVDALAKELSGVKSLSEKKTKEADTCKADKKKISDDIAATESEKKSDQNTFIKERLLWADEGAALKKKASETSKLCAYIDKNSVEARKLCGMSELPKPQEPKVEQPKPEEPKPEEPKAEPHKPEEPKAEAPKPEEPKAEPPKPEEPKAEPPKPEEPKAEPPKPEEPKAEPPKPEEPKAEPPKPEEPKAVEPKAKEP
ncbi:hypothetical protein E1301_Tti010895 [Triplophysa tibetana]|uniref:Uncharacterized protein n=1 Tax=Triplophysa tibetana TaxID=1572043 RepID=A0A5A9N383_9TELE|nr:hypothetical protein E1301_Tti010895 [Triplophysa tibetana]